MATWDATLPQVFQSSGFSQAEPDLVLTFKTDAGPPMLRKRCEAAARELSGDMVISDAQKTTLQTFYRIYCAEFFDFPDPDGGTDIEVMFSSPPSYTWLAPGYWKAAIKLMEVVNAA